MNSKRISVLGSGWLGLPLIEELINENYKVKTSTTSVERLELLKSLNVKSFIVDISNLSDDIIGFLESDTLLINITSKDIEGFKELISYIKQSEVKKLIFISSTSVFNFNNGIINESDNLEDKNHPLYIIENLFQESNEFETTILRFGGLIGYGRNPIHYFNKGLAVNNPDANINFIHRVDSIGIIKTILEKNILGEVFNCVADTHPTKREYYTQTAEQLKLPIPNFDSSKERMYKIISNERVKNLLEYNFYFPDVLKIPEEKL